jgi:hypothetical protein
MVSGLYDLRAGKGRKLDIRNPFLNGVAGGWQLGRSSRGDPVSRSIRLQARIAPSPTSPTTGPTPLASASRSIIRPRTSGSTPRRLSCSPSTSSAMPAGIRC